MCNVSLSTMWPGWKIGDQMFLMVGPMQNHKLMKSDAGRRHLSIKDVSLHDVFRPAVQLLRSNLIEKNHKKHKAF